MAAASRSTLDGVGLNKKHDEPFPVQSSSPHWPQWNGLRRRRLLWIILGLFAVYFFVKNIPTNVGPASQRQYYPGHGSMVPGPILAQAPLHSSKDAGRDSANENQYEGHIYFQNLAVSLRPHVGTHSDETVLFVMPDLQSTSTLLPIACQMAQHNHSIVHVAVLGRQDITFEDVLKLNRMTTKDCPVLWHDARPDHLSESSEIRIEAGIRAGLSHCFGALRPSVVIIDEQSMNKEILGGLLSETAAAGGVPLITFPWHVLQTMPWIIMLDSHSLRKMKAVEIDIVIQAYPESAGSLVRLLRSIESANYDGLFFPRLTVELPSRIDPWLSQFLTSFRWPPGSSPAQSQLTLRHRIDKNQIKPAEASMRTIESFYPHVPSTSHVLLMAPDAELSSSYMHYLMFTLLTYKYGRDQRDLSASLFGLSLELPQKRLDGQMPFIHHRNSVENPVVLVQAPNSNAALFLGEKWIEFRSFLAQRLLRDPELEMRSKPVDLVTRDYPSWLVEALDFMRAQGLYLLYPAFAAKNDLSVVKLHEELHQSPEEYARIPTDKKLTNKVDLGQIVENDVLKDTFKIAQSESKIIPGNGMLPIQALLSSRYTDSPTKLSELENIPMFSYDGKATNWAASQLASTEFANEFSLKQGGCTSSDLRTNADDGSIDRLFCNIG